MANQLLTRQELTRETLMILSNNLAIVPNFYRDYDQEFGKKGGKIGDTLYVRKPIRSIGRDGAGYAPEALVQTAVPVTINQQSGDDFEFSSGEKFLSLDYFSEQYLKPKAMAIANKLDFRAGVMAYQNTANTVGTPGVIPGLSGSDAFNTYALANQRLHEMGFPLKGGPRTLVITPAMQRGWTVYGKQWFNPQTIISEQWESGLVNKKAMGGSWFVDQNMPTHIIGALGGTPAINGANQTGTSILTSGWSATITNVLVAGDVLQFAGVFAVNPQNRASTGTLQDFVVQANASSDGGGLATIVVAPALVPSGQFQNVTASPAGGALISVFNTAAAGQGALAGLSTPQGLLWHKQAYCFVSFPGDVPENVDMGYHEEDPDSGVSLRFLRGFDFSRDMWPCRFDVYYGSAPLIIEGGVRICS